MNVNFCGAPTKNIKNDVQSLIKQCEKASISVAYLKKSGVELIKQSLDENKDSNAKISIITSLDFGITNVEGLRESLNMGMKCGIMHDKKFHPKLYIFEMGEGNAAMIVGSSNLSNGGLSTNYEANLVISGKVSDSPIKEAIEYFSLIESESVPLDEKIIDLYGERKSTIDEIKNQIGDDDANLDELNEYLNGKTSSENLTDDEIEDIFAEAEKSHADADSMYKKGMIHESVELYKKAYNIFNQFDDAHDSNMISDGKINCLVGMARSFCNLYQFESAQRYTNEAENLAKIIDDSDYLLAVLVWSVSSQTELDDKNKKCDQFIKRYESKQNKSEYSNDSGIGRVYLASANCKFKLNNKGEAIKNLFSAISHLENALQNSEDDWNRMIDHLNLAAVYEAKRIIDHKDDFDGIKITNHYEDALKLAKKLKSRFWEGSIRIDMAESFFFPSENETIHELKKARNIFSELGYDEIIQTVDEMTKKWEEYFKNN